MESLKSELSKREYYAALAMQAMISNHTIFLPVSDIVEASVKYADALIDALDANSPNNNS